VCCVIKQHLKTDETSCLLTNLYTSILVRPLEVPVPIVVGVKHDAFRHAGTSAKLQLTHGRQVELLQVQLHFGGLEIPRCVANLRHLILVVLVQFSLKVHKPLLYSPKIIISQNYLCKSWIVFSRRSKHLESTCKYLVPLTAIPDGEKRIEKRFTIWDW